MSRIKAPVNHVVIGAAEDTRGRRARSCFTTSWVHGGSAFHGKRDAVKRPFVRASASKCLLYTASYGINIYVARDFYVSFPFG